MDKVSVSIATNNTVRAQINQDQMTARIPGVKVIDRGGGGGSLPSGGTDGQYLVKDSTAEDGARWADLPVFAGTWSVTPLVEAETTLNTAGNYLDRDIVVEAIPYAEVSNPTGGITATIGG